MTTLAPRELHDLVSTCCRVSGIDVGTANRVADNVVAAEIASGGAAAVFADALDGVAASAFVSAPDRIVDAEIEARRNGTATVDFDPPVPAACVAATIEAAKQGGLAVATTVACGADGHPYLVAVRFSVANPYRDGFVVDDGVVARLEAAASRFYVSEALVDAAETPTD